MALFRRRKKQPTTTEIQVTVFDGYEPLEAVGESHYTDAFRSILGPDFTSPDQIRRRTVAVLIPEWDNPHDANAIAVYCEGQKCGYLPREDARWLRQPLLRLMKKEGGNHIGLEAAIVGREGKFGVFMDYDPDDFD